MVIRRGAASRSFRGPGRDADGVITSDDLTALGTRVCEPLQVTGSPKGTAILDGYARVWEQLRADCDADGDGQISREEFIAAADFFLSDDQARPGTSMLA